MNLFCQELGSSLVTFKIFLFCFSFSIVVEDLSAQGILKPQPCMLSGTKKESGRSIDIECGQDFISNSILGAFLMKLKLDFFFWGTGVGNSLNVNSNIKRRFIQIFIFMVNF